LGLTHPDAWCAASNCDALATYINCILFNFGYCGHKIYHAPIDDMNAPGSFRAAYDGSSALLYLDYCAFTL
jgi:hypothetical protein